MDDKYDSEEVEVSEGSEEPSPSIEVKAETMSKLCDECRALIESENEDMDESGLPMKDLSEKEKNKITSFDEAGEKGMDLMAAMRAKKSKGAA